ncbi:hypothetical protein QAD02_017051 [Eretmocerus hayati]|uniref:Uncharacterized protein n=1 Tax=Eretmocerus hayati TaxID=131215 RepID=A0ACC2PCB5_9HYME|nr:hypothetical protein QAD02_017051 [Eretmocerus hayati]
MGQEINACDKENGTDSQKASENTDEGIVVIPDHESEQKPSLPDLIGRHSGAKRTAEGFVVQCQIDLSSDEDDVEVDLAPVPAKKPRSEMTSIKKEVSPQAQATSSKIALPPRPQAIAVKKEAAKSEKSPIAIAVPSCSYAVKEEGTKPLKSGAKGKTSRPSAPSRVSAYVNLQNDVKVAEEKTFQFAGKSSDTLTMIANYLGAISARFENNTPRTDILIELLLDSTDKNTQVMRELIEVVISRNNSSSGQAAFPGRDVAGGGTRNLRVQQQDPEICNPEHSPADGQDDNRPIVEPVFQPDGQDVSGDD